MRSTGIVPAIYFPRVRCVGMLMKAHREEALDLQWGMVVWEFARIMGAHLDLVN